MNTATHENHPMTFFILILIIVTIGILGFTSFKNANNPVSSIVYITPTPIPTNTPMPKPTIQQLGTDEAGMTFQKAQQQKPPPPSGLTIIQLPDGLQLQWQAVRGSIAHYTIYRIEEKGKPKKIISITARKETELQTNGKYEFTDTTPQNGFSYTYSISATYVNGNESDLSDGVNVRYQTPTIE